MTGNPFAGIDEVAIDDNGDLHPSVDSVIPVNEPINRPLARTNRWPTCLLRKRVGGLNDHGD
jgi:hypothetical protein